MLTLELAALKSTELSHLRWQRNEQRYPWWVCMALVSTAMVGTAPIQ